MDEEAKMHLKEWLIAQVASGRYEGLSWEDDSKTMFRIPWKHAAKKDYKQTEDAALFKAWAVYKGKYKEGRDKADPTMWKTRLRCALNKSSDFEEVPERNQLDITEPFKVYRIQSDSQSARPAESKVVLLNETTKSPGSSGNLNEQLSRLKRTEEKPPAEDPMREHQYCDVHGKKHLHQTAAPVARFNPLFTVSGEDTSESAGRSRVKSPGLKPEPRPAGGDFRMQVMLLYQGQVVMKATTVSPDGCFILQGLVPVGNEQIYGPCRAQQFPFPSPASAALPSCIAEAMNRLLCHLERGVLLWVAPDGVFIKRFCQGRVYWSGPLARHSDQPNKLEREKTFKLLDTTTFLTALQSCLQGKGPTPAHEIDLCFGEEYPDPSVPKSRKLIMARVVPSFAEELLERFNLGENEEKRPNLAARTKEEEDEM